MKTIKLNEKKLKVLKMRDKTDNYNIEHDLISMPYRICIFASSGQGKSNLLGGLLLNENYKYYQIIKKHPERIFIFSPTIFSDNKLMTIVKQLDIEESNLIEDYSDEVLLQIYDSIVEDFKDRLNDDKPILPSWLILDDLSFSGKLANRFNALSKIYCNSRKFMVNIITLSQAYTQLAKNIRLQATAVFIFNTNNKELSIIEEEHNYLESGKKGFFKMFRDNVKKRIGEFLLINYSNNDNNRLYYDKDFKMIDVKQYDK